MNLTCPHCGAPHDRHSDPTRPNKAPINGDWSICIDCGEVSVFDLHEHCTLRAPTTDEANDIASDPGVLAYRLAWRRMKDDNSH
ncbi:Uncharacterised protein [Burkholderia pseudomallei]|uniref:hypothetical protein n=1 Tax=Burkholderia pseudomallei TaxID=28450 RepID=UPI0005E8985D|nr:hypothetical protein [Burkholderia pseudomallei]CAK1277870.1 Uncharacterised protein [Burkholderia pseudomallei]